LKKNIIIIDYYYTNCDDDDNNDDDDDDDDDDDNNNNNNNNNAKNGLEKGRKEGRCTICMVESISHIQSHVCQCTFTSESTDEKVQDI
jgi:hypothetical protein